MTHKEALELFSSNDLIGIGIEADKVRQKTHPENVVTYAVEGELDLAHAGNMTAVCERTERLTAMGASSVALLGALPDGMDVNRLAEMLRRLRPLPVSVTGLSPHQCVGLARTGGLPLESAIALLRDAGLRSIGSDPLNTRDEQSAEVWRKAHRAAHKAGMKTAAKVEFRTGDAPSQRLDAFDEIGRLQEEMGGFVSFSVTFTAAAAEEPTAVEYLKSLALARLCLPGISNCEDSWRGAGLKVCQLALRFGGNDLGSVAPIGSTCAPRSTAGIAAGDLRRLIRDASFLPKERAADYSAFFLD